MSYKHRLPLSIEEGGTAANSFTAYAVICSSSTGMGAFQSVSGLGTSGQVLTSNGPSALPTWQDAPSGNADVVFQTVASDPSSPTDSEIWFNITSNSFKGRANGSNVTFTVS